MADRMVADVPPALEAAIADAAKYLSEGGIVAFPTDTLYGLGALATHDEAVRRLYAVKGRPLDKPLPLLLAAAEDVHVVAAALPEEARRLMAAFWPGALTLVLRRRPDFHSLALFGDTAALRVPNHPVARRLIALAGGPVTGTSANRSGGPSPRTADEVRAQLDGEVDYILDAGPCPGGIESTVLDLTVDPPRIVRTGAISRAAIEQVLGRPCGE